MKLSKKGQIKIGESLCIFGRSLTGSRATALAQLAFEPGDFKGMVCLTVEEAKILHELALSTIRFLRPESAKALLSLKKRIEQVEKCDAND